MGFQKNGDLSNQAAPNLRAEAVILSGGSEPLESAMQNYGEALANERL
jgi:hypothetical protein